MVSRVIVSACLVGLPCAIDGKPRISDKLLSLILPLPFLAICPEVLAGLGCPRERAEIRHGDGFDVLAGRAKVYSESGRDLTFYFLKSAQEVLKIVRLFSPQTIYFRERSPSCGVHLIYDGSFTGSQRSGSGVTAALLKKEGYELIGWKE